MCLNTTFDNNSKEVWRNYYVCKKYKYLVFWCYFNRFTFCNLLRKDMGPFAADYEYKTCPTSYDDPKIRSNKDMGAYAKLENNTGVQFAYRLTRNVEILYTGFLDNLSKYE